MKVPNPAYPDDPQADPDWQMYCQEYILSGVNPDYDISQSVCQPYQEDFPGVPGVIAVALGSTVAVWEDGREEMATL